MKAVFALLFSCLLAQAEGIKWREWDPEIFARAKKENRFVLLDLGAAWCHWCHVMDAQTYAHPEVTRIIGEKYIAVRVDQDSRPDLAARYEEYGWPATVVFAADGSEIVKRQGYIPPQGMISMLNAIIDDPAPGPSVQKEGKIDFTKEALLPSEMRQELESALQNGYDKELGGWGDSHKYLDADNVEYCLMKGDAHLRSMARQTLDAQIQLMDPVWGGVYQYSAQGDWKHPHFEKIMAMQAGNIRVYALAYGLEKNKSWLDAAIGIHRYLQDFLMSPDGAFYTSQDADIIPGQHSAEYFTLDDKSRRQQGVPRIDQNIYSRENGWAISALVVLYEATGNKTYLDEAETAAQWIIKNRSLAGGGFAHGSQDKGGAFPGDTLAMGQAFLSLHEATGNRAWLLRASAAVNYLEATFASADKPGFFSPEQAQPQFDENVQIARFSNLLFRYTGESSHRAIAERAMRFIATPAVAKKRRAFVGGLLLANQEMTTDPIHILVAGDKNDIATKGLFTMAGTLPFSYKRIEIAAPGASPDLPVLGMPAAFLCTATTCSAPVKEPAKLKQLLDGIVRKNER